MEDPDIVLAAFNNLTQNGTVPATKGQLHEFVERYFNKPDSELSTWEPNDCADRPRFLDKVKDEELKRFGKDLCTTWRHLGRKIKDDVKIHPERYSLFYLENPFIVPGGRFREIYYWDSYWVIKGLLVCECHDTVKGMLENLLSLVRRFDKIPNGGRIYFQRRSQPPMLIPMIDSYVTATDDVQFLRDHMSLLEKDYSFWQTNRVVKVKEGTILNRYSAPTTKPRPESYVEDLETYNWNVTSKSREDLFADLSSACESGWDFSSRWLSQEYKEDTNKNKWLGYTNTRDVVPVDLNSILCWNEDILGKFYHRLENTSRAQFFERQHASRTAMMEDIFWDDTRGIWNDFLLSKRERNTDFFPSNIFPMFTKCYNSSKRNDTDSKVVQHLLNSQVVNYKGGVPTSLTPSGQQWDFPAAWPPLQHVIIMALSDSHVKEAQDLGFRLATNWVRSNFIGWNRTHKMFEKYDAQNPGSRGGGGEYGVQEGFGWTNGVILDLLDRFGQDLTLPETSVNASPYTHSSLPIYQIVCGLALIAFMALLA